MVIVKASEGLEKIGPGTSIKGPVRERPPHQPRLNQNFQQVSSNNHFTTSNPDFETPTRMPSTKLPPVIDFSDFLSGDNERMKRCASQIREACLTQGFFQIVNHNIPLSLQKEMFKISKEFFALPVEEKMKLDKSKVSFNFEHC